MPSTQREISSVSAKANLLNRFIAKFVDLLIVSAIAQIPLPSAFLAALGYILIADGFAEGKSPGKQLIGLVVRSNKLDRVVDFGESIVRNFSLAMAYLLFFIPYIGWLFALAILGFESLLLIGNTQGRRMGDELAKTQVLDHTKIESLET